MYWRWVYQNHDWLSLSLIKTILLVSLTKSNGVWIQICYNNSQIPCDFVKLVVDQNMLQLTCKTQHMLLFEEFANIKTKHVLCNQKYRKRTKHVLNYYQFYEFQNVWQWKSKTYEQDAWCSATTPPAERISSSPYSSIQSR